MSKYEKNEQDLSHLHMKKNGYIYTIGRPQNLDAETLLRNHFRELIKARSIKDSKTNLEVGSREASPDFVWQVKKIIFTLNYASFGCWLAGRRNTTFDDLES